MELQLFAYDDVAMHRANGEVWVGTIISYLSLYDWAMLNNFVIVSVNGFRPAEDWERTDIYPQYLRRPAIAVPA